MKRYVETFFRYWFIALLPLVALMAIEGQSVRHMPHLFTAALNIYAENSLMSANTSTTYMTPAQIEVANIAQWLQSPSFCLAVAKGSPLYARALQLVGDPQSKASADLTANAQAVPKGDNLVTIQYTSPDPALAMQVVRSLLDNATTRTQSFQARQASVAVSYYQYQLNVAQSQERASAQKLTDYMQQHDITATKLTEQLASDLTLAGLYEQNKTDHSNVVSLRNKIQSYMAQNSVPSSVSDQVGYVFADPPHYFMVSNRKKGIMNLAIGLVLGLLLSIGFVTIMTALDRSLRQPEEVPALLELPVLAVLPYSPHFGPRQVGISSTSDQAAYVSKAKGASAS